MKGGAVVEVAEAHGPERSLGPSEGLGRESEWGREGDRGGEVGELLWGLSACSLR